jgi:hypothetical protein
METGFKSLFTTNKFQDQKPLFGRLKFGGITNKYEIIEPFKWELMEGNKGYFCIANGLCFSSCVP